MWIHADPNPQPWSKCSNFFYYLGSDTSYDSESTVSIKCGIFLVPLYYMYCNRVHAPTFQAISDLEYIQRGIKDSMLLNFTRIFGLSSLLEPTINILTNYYMIKISVKNLSEAVTRGYLVFYPLQLLMPPQKSRKTMALHVMHASVIVLFKFWIYSISEI